MGGHAARHAAHGRSRRGPGGTGLPPAGVAGAAPEAGIFAWVRLCQRRSGDRGRALAAYALFLAMAVAVLLVDAGR